MTYYADDVTGDPASALITITYLPEAADDSDLGNAFGTDVNVDVLANDTGDFPAGNRAPARRRTAGDDAERARRGHLDGRAGRHDHLLARTSGFLVDPTTVQYQVTDSTGDTVTASITVTYLPLARRRRPRRPGHRRARHGRRAVQRQRLVRSPRRCASSTRSPCRRCRFVVVAGQGTWSLGARARSCSRRCRRSWSTPTRSTTASRTPPATPPPRRSRSTTCPAAADDSDLGNALGSVVDVDVLDNDTGSFDVELARVHGRRHDARRPRRGHLGPVQAAGSSASRRSARSSATRLRSATTSTDVTGDAVTRWSRSPTCRPRPTTPTSAT